MQKEGKQMKSLRQIMKEVQYPEELETREDAPTYELVYGEKLEKDEEPLSRVIGHENQKKELLLVVDWFKRSKELKEKGVSIPKGVILFGAPGNGKSLLIKEIIRYADAPVFIFQGEQENVVEGIVETFKKAREAGHAIIVFDELDLLIDKERRVIRALQENLDGVESSDDILVLAATNDIDDIPGALLRHGRLEKLIKVPYPTGEEALELLKKHFEEFNLKFPDDFDEEEMALSLNGISCAGVKSVVNDLVLRNGFENITTDMIFTSIYNITDRVKDRLEKDNLDVAIHEAGHAVVAKSFPQYFSINSRQAHTVVSHALVNFQLARKRARQREVNILLILPDGDNSRKFFNNARKHKKDLRIYNLQIYYYITLPWRAGDGFLTIQITLPWGGLWVPFSLTGRRAKKEAVP